ncbi:MAG: DUF2905 domain-containing protein [Candidatus Zixiibacteriota bacterium]|jgi:hypothetical protein
MTPQLGKLLIIAGIILVVIGVLFLFAGRIPFLGKFPGDIHIKKDNYSVYIPIATMLIISILLTIILNLFGRGK